MATDSELVKNCWGLLKVTFWGVKKHQHRFWYVAITDWRVISWRPFTGPLYPLKPDVSGRGQQVFQGVSGGQAPPGPCVIPPLTGMPECDQLSNRQPNEVAVPVSCSAEFRMRTCDN